MLFVKKFDKIGMSYRSIQNMYLWVCSVAIMPRLVKGHRDLKLFNSAEIRHREKHNDGPGRCRLALLGGRRKGSVNP